MSVLAHAPEGEAGTKGLKTGALGFRRRSEPAHAT